MSATALATLEASGAPDVLVDYARFVAGLSIGLEAKRHRRNAACELLNAHPDLKAWMARPTRARLADLARSHAWSFITWCFLEQVLVPDLDLLLTKTPGDLYAEWGQRHADDVARVSEIARRYSWSAHWTRDVATNALAMVCLWSGNDLDELTDDVFDTFTAALVDTPSARPGATPVCTTRPGPSVSTRPATSCGSATTPHARTDRLQPPSPRRSKPSPNQRSARLPSATWTSWPRPCAPRPCC